MIKNNVLVKSSNDGKLYYETTRWSYIIEYLTDALDCFSEIDSSGYIYHVIDSLLDEISEMSCSGELSPKK